MFDARLMHCSPWVGTSPSVILTPAKCQKRRERMPGVQYTSNRDNLKEQDRTLTRVYRVPFFLFRLSFSPTEFKKLTQTYTFLNMKMICRASYVSLPRFSLLRNLRWYCGQKRSTFSGKVSMMKRAWICWKTTQRSFTPP